MTTIETLAQNIRVTHDIDSLDAARRVVQAHVDQIADDPNLWDASTYTLTDAGVKLLTRAIAESYAHGYYATEAQRLIEDIADEATTIQRRAELIRAALKTELPRTAIAEAASLNEAQLDQIRDSRS